jgi:hypothetical protein
VRAGSGATKTALSIRILEESSVPTSAEGGSQSVLKVLQSLAGCAVYGMLDGLSSNVSSGHNAKMYTAALGPSYMLYAIRMPHTYRYNPTSAGCVTVISRVRQPRASEVSNLTYLLLIAPCFHSPAAYLPPHACHIEYAVHAVHLFIPNGL